MPELNTGWKQWDKYLPEYIGKPINIMEIGVYEGIATSWFLKNIMTNSYSKLYAIDTFEGSPEYPNNVNFSKIERTFKKNIEKTGRASQVVIMKMFSIKALNKILYDDGNNIMFDIIYIDASHEAKDVISDAILSWNLLNIGGTMIFDDYRWNKLVEEHSRPKLAVDSFVRIMRPSIKTLYSGYQYIIKKVAINKENKVIIRSKIIDEINNLYNYFIKSIKDEPIIIKAKSEKLHFELRFTKINDFYDNVKCSNQHDLFKKIIKKYNTIRKLKNYDDIIIYKPSLLVSTTVNDVNKHTDEIYKKFINNTKNIPIFSYLKMKNIHYSWFENFILQLQMFKKNKNNVNYLNFNHRDNYIKNFFIEGELKYIYNILRSKKYTNFKFYNISCTPIFDKNKNLYSKKFINLKTKSKLNVKTNYLNLKNLNNMLYIAKDLKGKLDIINLFYASTTYGKATIISRAKIPSLFYSALFVLMTQNKGGIASIWTHYLTSKSIQQIIYLLSIYYETVEIRLSQSNTMVTSATILELRNFKGINDSELKNLIKIAKEIDKNIPGSGLETSIKNEKLRKKFLLENKINENTNEIFIENILNNSIPYDIQEKIDNAIEIKYKLYVGELDLITRVNYIINEIIKDKGKSKMYQQIMTTIFNKQMQYAYSWLEYFFKNNLNLIIN